MAYNLDAIKQKIADLNGGRKPGDKKRANRPKLAWFKPSLGPSDSPNSYEIRFLPYTDANEQPFQEVSYYDNKQLHEHRLVAPAQFGMKDPIFELLDELRKEGTRESWRLWGTLRPKDRFYAPVLVRGEEDRGVQVWELNAKILKDIYSVLAHPDYADENMMDVENGFDFTLNVTDSGKKFNQYTIKNYDIQPRRKPSKLASTQKARDELVNSVPNLEEYFKSMVRDPEYLDKVVENFVAKTLGSTSDDNDEDTSSDNLSVARGRNSSDEDEKALKSIDDAFDDLDDEDSPF